MGRLHHLPPPPPPKTNAEPQVQRAWWLVNIETSCDLARRNQCRWEELSVEDRRMFGATVGRDFIVDRKRQEFIGCVVTRVAHDDHACPTCHAAGATACQHVWGVHWSDNEQSGSSCLCFVMRGMRTEVHSMQVTSTQVGGSHHS